MTRREVAALLARTEGWLSGEEMSRALGVTRAAVWKEIAALRGEGWPIAASTRLGYRLEGPPPVLSAPYLNAMLPPDSLFAGKVAVEDRVDSTNTRLKAQAAAGAPAGSVLLTLEQTGGRGTHGRSFQSPRGEGLYLSVLLRPRASIEDLLTLTGWAAVAVREGIEAACGAAAEIKWLNDIYLNGRKLVGILTELSLLSESAEPDYVVIGMGVNLTQSEAVFRAQGLEDIAISLAQAGRPANPNTLTLALLEQLDALVRDFPGRQADWLERYRAHCLTPGRRVSFDEDGRTLTGAAKGIDGRFALLVAGDDGREHTVSSGTVRLIKERDGGPAPGRDHHDLPA